MTTQAVRVPVDPPLDAVLADELRSRVLFVDDRIDGFDLESADGVIVGVVLRGADLGDSTALERKLHLLVERQIRPQVPVPVKVVWRSGHHRPADPDLFDELQSAGWATVQGEGQVALAGPVLDLVRILDRLLVDRLASLYDVTEYSYPTLIRSESLRTAGYFGSFPQHLMFVTRLQSDLDTYGEFADDLAAGGDTAGFLEHCRNLDYCLPPTMCYHTFAQLRGGTVSGDLRVVTARGKSFRHEAGYHTTLERLWDFTIREMVFLGAREQVLTARQRVLESTQSWLVDLGLEARCEVANDPFFGSDAVPDAVGSQRLLELKYELRMPLGDDRDLAVGSFNFHDDVFGNRFSIQGDDGKPIRSGCVGFGLERLAFAVLSQCGTSPSHWPDALAEPRRGQDAAVPR